MTKHVPPKKSGGQIQAVFGLTPDPPGVYRIELDGSAERWCAAQCNSDR